MMYLAVSLSGFLVIFIARTRSFFFTRRPGTPLLIATVFALATSTAISTTNLIGEEMNERRVLRRVLLLAPRI